MAQRAEQASYVLIPSPFRDDATPQITGSQYMPGTIATGM
jgi:hypothetical protein